MPQGKAILRLPTTRGGNVYAALLVVNSDLE